jgi:hypothetical protein
MARLRSDFWVSAYLRRCSGENMPAVLRRRGAPEAGAIFIKVDRLDGTATLFGPAPQSEVEDGGDRRFAPVHKADALTSAEIEQRLSREIGFDPDLWILEVDDRTGTALLG